MSPTDTPSWRARLKGPLRFAAGLGLFVVVLRWLAPDWGELAARVELDWRWAVLGLLGTSAASFVTAARWKLLAELMGGTRLPFSAYFHGLVLTRLLGQFTSTMAMDLVGRGAALKAAGSERGIGHAIMQVVLERLFDGLLPVMLLAWAVSLREGWIPLSPGSALLVFCLVFTAVAIPLLAPATRVAVRSYLWLRPRLTTLAATLRARLERLRRRSARPPQPCEGEAHDTPPPSAPLEIPTVSLALSARVAGYSLLRFAAVVVQFWGIAGAVGISLSWLEITTATPVAQLAGMLGLTPGGLGILEAGWVGGLGWVGQDAVTISLFVLAQRVGVISFFGLLTALSAVFGLLRKGLSSAHV